MHFLMSGVDANHASDDRPMTFRYQIVKNCHSCLVGRVGLATRFCEAFEEVRNHFRFRTQMKEKVSLSVRRQIYLERWLELKGMFLAA